MTWERLRIGAPFLVVSTLFTCLGFVFGLASCGGAQADQRAQTLALVTAAASCAGRIDPGASSAVNARNVIACVLETARDAAETCRPAEGDAARHDGPDATVNLLGF